MYIPRSRTLKVNQLNRKRVLFGYKPYYPRTCNLNWYMKNFENLMDEKGADELNKKISLTKEEALSYEKEMGESWPHRIVSSEKEKIKVPDLSAEEESEFERMFGQ